MPKAYAVVSYRSNPDPQKLAAYSEIALPAVAALGLLFLHAATPRWPANTGSKSAPLLSNIRDWRKRLPPITVGYAAALKALDDGAVRDFRIVEGVDNIVYADWVTGHFG
jgi:hypothetical protein